MKLVIATPLYPPESGGPATYAKLLTEHLSADESGAHERDFVALVKFSDVRHLPKIIRHSAYFFKVLKAGRSADVILALDPVSTGFPAALAAGMLRKPFVVKIVGDFAWEQGRQRFGITRTRTVSRRMFAGDPNIRCASCDTRHRSKSLLGTHHHSLGYQTQKDLRDI
jgi:glycosyltransferase involved in cell wall biosynthesis